MKHAIFGDVQMVPVSSIRELPRNKTIHADFDPAGRDAWIVADLRAHGIVEPLLIRPDRTLIGGHRRLGWAKLDKVELVPCIVVQNGCEDAAYLSTQLARHVPLYAKCVLYRAVIADLIRRGADVAQRNLTLRHAPGEQGAGGNNADDSILNQDWIKCEEVLGVSRRFLLRGIKLLETIEAMTATGQPEEMDRAARVLSIFRNRGLEPARRMLGETTAAADAAEPDCIDWQSADDDDDLPAKKATGKRAKEILKYAKKDGDVPPPAWVVETLKCLGRIETLAKKHGFYVPSIESALDEIEQQVVGETAKRAA